MKLLDYYIKILDKYSTGNYKIIRKNKNVEKKELLDKYHQTEAINYIIFEFMEDNKDKRRFNIFDYYFKPKGLGNTTKMEEHNYDFTKVSFEEFFEFLKTIKK